jgi:hypothetical protein
LRHCCRPRLRPGRREKDHPSDIQILTIKDLLELGKRPDLPPFRMHYPRPEHPELVAAEQRSIFGTTG